MLCPWSTKEDCLFENEVTIRQQITSKKNITAHNDINKRKMTIKEELWQGKYTYFWDFILLIVFPLI